MDAREKAVQMVRYFTSVSRQSPDIEVWGKGLKTAQEWLRLIDAPSVSEQEVIVLMGVIHAHRWHTSGWGFMASDAYHWAESQDIALPPVAEFFANESLTMFLSMSTVDCVQKLIEIYSRNTREDPDYEPWHTGLYLTKQWFELIQSENVTEEAVISLVFDTSKYGRRNFDSLGTALHVEVLRWANQLGYADEVRAILHGLHPQA